MSNEKVCITFGLPCYNVSEYVNDCIQSIIEQNLSVKYEILCIDDCSTDNTYDILLKAAKSNPNIQIYKNESNSGISFNRNKIIEKAKGKYIWFLDPDDMMFPNVAQHMVELCEKSHSDWCCANYVEFQHGSIPSTTNLVTQYGAIQNHTEKCGTNLIPLSKNQYGNIAASVWCGVWNRDFLINNKIKFDTKVSMMEDMLFKLKTEAFNRKVVYIDYPIYIYRIRPHSLTTTTSYAKKKLLFHSSFNFITAMKNINCNNNIDFQNKVARLMEKAKENAAISLTQVGSLRFAKISIKQLKDNGYYPYPFQKELLQNIGFNKDALRKINIYLLPFEPWLWCACLLRKIYNFLKGVKK